MLLNVGQHHSNLALAQIWPTPGTFGMFLSVYNIFGLFTTYYSPV